jgi:hypothetical protein
MKIFLLVISALVLSNCRKQVAVDMPSNSEIVGETPLIVDPCANGIKDGTEEAIDCGGTCNACVLAQGSCASSLIDNRVHYYGLGTVIYSSASCSSTTSSGVLVITSSFSNRLTVTFGTSNPTPYTSYVVTSNPNPNANEVYVTYDYTGTLYTSISGTLYYNLIASKNSVEFCDIQLINGASSTFIDGRLID